MTFRPSAAPLALLLAAASAPTFAQTPTASSDERAVTTVDSIIVTGRRDPEEPPVVARARARLSRTPGAVAVVSAESLQTRYAPNIADVLRDVPGVYAQKKWGGDVRIAIRGSGIGNANHLRGLFVSQPGRPCRRPSSGSTASRSSAAGRTS